MVIEDHLLALVLALADAPAIFSGYTPMVISHVLVTADKVGAPKVTPRYVCWFGFTHGLVRLIFPSFTPEITKLFAP